jgi:uncharacterized protein YbjT (DUF2867 family)
VISAAVVVAKCPPSPEVTASLPAGIELAVGDLDDPESVSKAVAGVEAIFLMQVGGGTEQTRR